MNGIRIGSLLRHRRQPRRLTQIAALALSAAVTAGTLASCGGGSSLTSSSGATKATTSATVGQPTATRPAGTSPQLKLVGRSALPEARSGGAAAAFNAEIVFSGGLSSAGTSTTAVFTVAGGGVGAGTAGQLPGPVHDAALAQLGDQLLLFGGGRSEGSDRIVRVLPGPAKVVGHIPQALSDLDAAVIGNVAYVLGGWNGSATNRSIYAVRAVGAADLQVATVARLPLGVRYPAAASLAGRVIIAGGEMTSGNPTADAWSFDPASGTLSRLPSLPAPTDHAPGAVLNGRFYLLGGLRRGSFSSTILSWAPGENHWTKSGRLPEAISDATAVSLASSISVLGGRGASGTVADVTRLAAQTP